MEIDGEIMEKKDLKSTEKKYLVVTDIHGSNESANKMKELIEKETPDCLVILGDVYYHGPRNNFPGDYNPMKVCDFLKSVKCEKILIKGNCDSEVDEMISECEFLPICEVISGGKVILFTHGHKINNNMPTNRMVDACVYGHSHINNFCVVDGVKYINISSISLPKENNPPSYAVIFEGKINIFSTNATKLNEIDI